MSREIVRTRPTREETRIRLFEAAAEVIEQYGIGDATIDRIARAAGFSRGAFYSNFENKDDLLVTMLEDHLARSIDRNAALLIAHRDANAFLDALRRDSGQGGDPLHRSPLLQVELTLHVARRTELRPVLADRLRAMRTLVGTIASETLTRAGIDPTPSVDELGMILVAVEDGLRLHRLIDPDTTPANAFVPSLQTLLDLIANP